MTGEVETKAEDTEEGQIVTRWLREIELASQHEKKWRDRARKVVERFRDERDENESGKKFNILYANTEVLRGVIYNRVPVPDVRRRFLAKDPVGREASQVLQRALSFCADSYDFDDVLSCAVEDYLLPGRAMAKVRYVPTYGPMIGADGQPVIGEDGQPMQQVIYETVETDYVEWDMVRISPAKRWSKVRWVAFGELLTRDELVKQFGEEIGKACSLDWSPKEKDKEHDMYKRALVWSIWDKPSRSVHVVSKGMPGQRLKVVQDPLGLKDFFPCPKPVYSIKTNGNMVPIPEYCQYQDQAMELDELTERISVLTGALKRRGVYNGTYSELQKLATAGDNEFIAIEKFAEFVQGGGLEKAIYESPIDVIAAVVLNLYRQRDQVKAIIYEETGIADVVRGVSDSSETLGAQQLKAQYADSRIAPRQKAIQNFARDLYRLKAEIIAEKFSPQTLAQMTGFDLIGTEQEKQALAQAGQQIPALKKPSWEQVIKLLRDEKLRGFRVDIETDSTVEPDAAEEQKNRVGFLGAVTNFVSTIQPAVQSGAIPLETAKEMLSFGARAFKVSPQMEDALDAIGGDPDQRGQDKQKQEQKKQVAEQVAVRKQMAEVEEIEAKSAEAKAKARKADAEAAIVEHQLQMHMGGMMGGMPAPGPVMSGMGG